MRLLDVLASIDPETNDSSKLKSEATNGKVTENPAVDIQFMSELPHPEQNEPVDIIRSGGVQVMYYKNNPRTIGEIEGGIPPIYKYPQVAVVTNKEGRPLKIIRVEESTYGTSAICAIEPSGQRSNFGSFSQADRETFLKKVSEILSAA